MRSGERSGFGVRGIVLLLAMAAWSAPALAREGDTRATLYIGTTRFVASDASTYGTTFGFTWGYELIDDLLWTLGLAASTTDGTVGVGAQTYPISAQTTTGQTGLAYYFNRSPTSLFIPFVGGGLSLMQYDINYAFPNSQLGKTSGTGAGAYANAGLEIWLSRSTTLIVQYQAAEHEVQTQSGRKITLESGGLLLALRIGVRG